MEVAGLVVGVAGLATSFNACMECFDYIQMGRNFGHDFGNCQLRLDSAKLRMSRWGASVGLGRQSGQDRRIPLKEEDLHVARSLFEHIMGSFEDAERMSERYQKHVAMQDPNSAALTVYNAKEDLDASYKRVHETMRELAIRRQGETSLLKKARWALYEKKKFTAMIEEITGFVSALVELFPAVKDEQRVLCRTEVGALTRDEDLELFGRTSDNDDEILQHAIKDELSRRGHKVTVWKADGTSKVRVGDENASGVESKGHISSKFSVSGSADVWIGNTNR